MKIIVSFRSIRLPLGLTLCCLFAFVLANTVSSEAPRNISSAKSNQPGRIFDIGLGRHNFSFQMGRETKTQYLGAAAMRQAMEAQQVEPRSMVSDDFNVDGMGDLVIGYANANGGVLGLRQGNLQALAPTDPAILEGVGQGRYPAPFLPEVSLYSSPEAPDFLQVGDFNSDGYSDVIAGARMSPRLYMFPGDGRGHLGEPQSFELEGLLTAMQAGREQPGVFTTLAVGLLTPGGANLSVYNVNGRGLAGAPESYPMPVDVTALAFGDLNNDGMPDVAAAAGSEVAVVYQRENVPVPVSADGKETAAAAEANNRSIAPAERTTFPFVIRGLAAGNFVFDREHQVELALLTDGGAVHLTNKGETDRRPFSKEELTFIQEQRKAWHKGEQDMAALGRQMEKLVRLSSRKSAAWTVTETLDTGAAAPYSGAPGLLQAARMTGLGLDDLLVGNSADNSVQVVKNKEDIQKLKIKNGDALAQTESVKVEGEPLAAIAMRLSVNGLPGTVVLHKGTSEPKVNILTPDAVFAVTTTLDQIDLTPGNGVCNSASGCSLRAAVIESNYAGGSNTITLPNGTYTLTLGPWDDEFNANGAVMESGDLDILDLSAFLAVPALTAVTINGGGRDTAIIQMGTLSPSSGGIATDRVMETNNFAIPQRGTSLTLNNLTVRNGNAQKSPAPDNYNTKGGGIQFDGFDSYTNTNLGVLTLTNTKFTTNTSAGQGGGILAIFGGLTVQTTSIVSSNTSTFAAGGGIQHSGGNVITTTINITNSTIGGATAPEGNNAPDSVFGIGAGMDSVGANAVNITGTTIRNNVGGIQAGSNGGGGLHFGNSKSIAIATSTISENKSKHHGGGIWVSARDAVSNMVSTYTLTTVNVTGNQADSDGSGAGDGGGLAAYFGTGTVQTTSHIDGNSAFNGGGISTAWSAIAGDPAAGITVNTSSTIGQAGAGNGNSARNNGGSIYINATGAPSFSPINLTALTFTNNTANSDNTGGGDGGAIFIGAGQLTSLSGCTIDGNVANGGTGDGIRQTGGTITGAGTLNFNGFDSISISGGTFTSTSGTLNLTGNLLFTGGTFTHNSGTWVMNGSSAQTIGTSPITFFNLTVNNGSGVTLNGNTTVAGTLNLTNGVLGIGTNTLTLTGPVSFTSGTITSGATGTVNYTQAAANQIVVPGTYGNLFFSNFVKVLPNGATVNIAGTFTPGTAAPTITGSTVDFNGTGLQTVPAINYNNLTISGNRGAATVTLASGIIGVAGIFNPSATNVAYTKTGNTFDFNGAGTQTIPAFNYNNLTVSNTHGANPVTLVNGGIIGVAGTFTPGSSTFTITGNTMDFNGTGVQTIPAFSFNNLTVSNTHGANAVTLINGGTINVAGVFTPGTSVFTNTGNTFAFNGAGTQTVPGFNYNNLTISNTHGANVVTLENGGTIGVAGIFAPGSSIFAITGNTVSFNGAGTQTIPAFNYNNLSVANTHGANAVTLVNGGTIGVAGTFTPGTSIFTITGNTMDFNGAGAQTVSAFNYNNLTISGNRSGLAVTLASGNIGIAGIFNPSVTNNTFVTTGNIVIFNGSALQSIPAFTFNGLTLNNAAGATLAGNVTVGAGLTLTAGALGVGANTLTLNGAVSATAGSLTSGTTGTVNYNQGSNGQATVLATNYGNLTFSSFSKTLASTGTIGVAGTFTPGTGTGHTITGSTINFNGAGAQAIPGFTYNNLTSSGGGQARTLDPVNVIKIAGLFTPGTDVYTITGSTIEYNGAVAQTLPASGFNTYNNLVLNNPAGTTGFAGLTVQGLLEVRAGTFTSASTFNNVQINIGATLAGTNATTMNVSGIWTNNGGFTGNGNTVNFNGSAAQTIGGSTATTFSNLTINNTLGLHVTGVTLLANATVNGLLTLTSSDLATGANTLTMPNTATSGPATGGSDVVGNIKRTGFVSGGGALSFGNALNTIRINSGTAPTDINVLLAKNAPVTYAAAVQRSYTITPNGGSGITATVRLHYRQAELNGNDDTSVPNFNFRRFTAGAWKAVVPTSRNTGVVEDNWLESNAVTQFSEWTFVNLSPSAATSSVRGVITDSNGTPVEGVVVRLSGAQIRKTITDTKGRYAFDNVDVNAFYTVTPARSNYHFSPTNRAFTQLANQTEAAFGAVFDSDSQNPLDTPEYFVRQQYVDILGREPDEGGFNYWSDEILRCGNDAGCVNARRSDIAAAFFIEQEFQQTGSYIYNLYKGSLGRRPGYSEFAADRRQVIGGPDLETEKSAFAAGFVQRPDFVQKYQANTTAESFVDALLANVWQTSNLDLGTQRGVLLALYQTGSDMNQSRALVLQQVAENPSLKSVEYNPAFVLTEYFGYLRRNPEPEGYDFWLNVLNHREPGNFRGMVCSFITSTEYQQRFSAVVTHSNAECGK